MTARAALVAALKADAGVLSACGGRIYPSHAPQGAAFPFVTYDRITGQRVRHQGGPSGLLMESMQLDLVGDDAAAVEALAEAIRAAIDGARGTYASTTVDLFSLEPPRDQNDGTPGGDELPLFRTTIDVDVWHRESVS